MWGGWVQRFKISSKGLRMLRLCHVGHVELSRLFNERYRRCYGMYHGKCHGGCWRMPAKQNDRLASASILLRFSEDLIVFYVMMFGLLTLYWMTLNDWTVAAAHEYKCLTWGSTWFALCPQIWKQGDMCLECPDQFNLSHMTHACPCPCVWRRLKDYEEKTRW